MVNHHEREIFRTCTTKTGELTYALENLKGRHHSTLLGTDGRVLLKWSKEVS